MLGHSLHLEVLELVDVMHLQELELVDVLHLQVLEGGCPPSRSRCLPQPPHASPSCHVKHPKTPLSRFGGCDSEELAAAAKAFARGDMDVAVAYKNSEGLAPAARGTAEASGSL